MALDFTIIDTAGLTKTEFAALVGVTRVTVHHWVNTGSEPTPYLQTPVAKILKHLSAAVENNSLPGQLLSLTPNHRNQEERMRIIGDALEAVSE